MTFRDAPFVANWLALNNYLDFLQGAAGQGSPFKAETRVRIPVGTPQAV
jgi:hypothetical protein